MPHHSFGIELIDVFHHWISAVRIYSIFPLHIDAAIQFPRTYFLYVWSRTHNLFAIVGVGGDGEGETNPLCNYCINT